MEEETSNGGARRCTTEQPPLTVAEAPTMNKRPMRVMVAVDESDTSLYALKWTLANLFNKPVGAENPDMEPDPEQGMVTVVHVVKPFERYTFPADAAMYTSASMVESVRKAQRQNAAQLISRAFQVCKETKIKAETLILEGDPKDMICQAVEEMHFDLLVVGSRGFGAMKRAFLGSISDFCAHHARCPVLIVKPSDHK